jgi:hypothetical protein
VLVTAPQRVDRSKRGGTRGFRAQDARPETGAKDTRRARLRNLLRGKPALRADQYSEASGRRRFQGHSPFGVRVEDPGQAIRRSRHQPLPERHGVVHRWKAIAAALLAGRDRHLPPVRDAFGSALAFWHARTARRDHRRDREDPELPWRTAVSIASLAASLHQRR